MASGGVWKTSNWGLEYIPVFDSEDSYSIGCVTIDPNNPKVVWVGTGENNNQRSVAYGDGIYKSTDGGKSWENMGLKDSEHIGNIIVHPDNSDVIYVSAYGPLWSKGGEREYTCQRMVVKTGRGFCMLTSTQVSMRFTWIQKS